MIEQLHKYFLQSTGVSTDTRNITLGNLFFALKGENFNGNSYAEKALQEGAAFAVIDEPQALKSSKLILVDDALETLQKLANFHRRYLAIPIISLTGSNGKTTTKELINAVLSKKFETVATRGNLNNHIGVPLTLLSMTSSTKIGIVEMGANHLNEIADLCKIAEPNYGYITNFGKAHLEGFGSEAAIVQGKSELYDFIKANGQLVFANSDDSKQQELTKTLNKFTFGRENSDVLIESITANPFVSITGVNETFDTKLIGLYNGTNVAAAVAIGTYFEVKMASIKEAVTNYIPSNNRSQIIEKGNLTIILDAYNANPSSMLVALDNLKQLDSERKIAVLGDMFELGDSAESEHQEILNHAEKCDLDSIIIVGENFHKTESASARLKKYSSTESLLNAFTLKPKAKTTLLIKGSRGMALERLLKVL